MQAKAAAFLLKLVNMVRAMEHSTYVSGNFGLPLGANGFVNTTFEIGSTEDTNRAVQRADAAQLSCRWLSQTFQILQ